MTHFATLSQATQWVETNAKRGKRVLWLIPTTSTKDYTLIMDEITMNSESWISLVRFFPFTGVKAFYQNGGLLLVTTNTDLIPLASADIIFAPPTFPFDDRELLGNPERGFVSWNESS